MLRDLVGTYYLERNYNCAESIFLAINEAYGLGFEERHAKLLGGFGGGMGCGRCCGALAACIAMLGEMKIGKKAHETAGFKELCTSFVKEFERKEGGVDCNVLKPAHFTPQSRCLQTVLLAADLFDSFMGEQKERDRL